MRFLDGNTYTFDTSSSTLSGIDFRFSSTDKSGGGAGVVSTSNHGLYTYTSTTMWDSTEDKFRYIDPTIKTINLPTFTGSSPPSWSSRTWYLEHTGSTADGTTDLVVTMTSGESVGTLTFGTGAVSWENEPTEYSSDYLDIKFFYHN